MWRGAYTSGRCSESLMCRIKRHPLRLSWNLMGMAAKRLQGDVFPMCLTGSRSGGTSKEIVSLILGNVSVSHGRS